MDDDFDGSPFFESFYFRDEHQLGIGIPKIDEGKYHL